MLLITSRLVWWYLKPQSLDDPNNPTGETTVGDIILESKRLTLNRHLTGLPYAGDKLSDDLAPIRISELLCCYIRQCLRSSRRLASLKPSHTRNNSAANGVN
jgi:hypothetical protein